MRLRLVKWSWFRFGTTWRPGFLVCVMIIKGREVVSKKGDNYKYTFIRCEEHRDCFITWENVWALLRKSAVIKLETCINFPKQDFYTYLDIWFSPTSTMWNKIWTIFSFDLPKRWQWRYRKKESFSLMLYSSLRARSSLPFVRRQRRPI